MEQGRKPMPYWIFLVAGALVTVVSLITIFTVENSSNGMKLFLATGIIFLLIGAFKFFTQKTDGQTPEQRLATRVMDVNLNKAVRTIQRQHDKEYRQPDQKRPPELIRCQRCQTLNYDHSNYCHMCGYRVN